MCKRVVSDGDNVLSIADFGARVLRDLSDYAVRDGLSHALRRKFLDILDFSSHQGDFPLPCSLSQIMLENGVFGSVSNSNIS